MKRASCLVLSALLLAACATAELNENTLDLAGTVGYLQTAQIIDNLGRFIDSPDAIPAQIALTGGIVQIANTINPTWMRPYSFLTTGGVTTASKEKVLQLDYIDQWTENWNLAPVSDSEDLKRLRALYRYAVYGDAHDCAARCSKTLDFDGDYSATFIRDIQGRAHNVEPVPRIHDDIHTGWLYWSAPGGGKAVLPAPPPGPVHSIGTAEGRTLFTTDPEYYSDFVIAVQTATVQTRTEPRSVMGPVVNP
jgi:hypothetical protein